MIYINDAGKNYDVPTPNVYMTRMNICSLIAPPVNPPTWVITGIILHEHKAQQLLVTNSLSQRQYSTETKSLQITFFITNLHKIVCMKSMKTCKDLKHSPQDPEKEQNCSTTFLLRAEFQTQKTQTVASSQTPQFIHQQWFKTTSITSNYTTLNQCLTKWTWGCNSNLSFPYFWLQDIKGWLMSSPKLNEQI